MRPQSAGATLNKMLDPSIILLKMLRPDKHAFKPQWLVGHSHHYPRYYLLNWIFFGLDRAD
ncbi:MAG TPA: hypothetical protein VL492_09170 [Methylovirgula sp.]|jgi:hypothetical protein|nr:hypothetical protein [Methylovirgula sp.]